MRWNGGSWVPGILQNSRERALQLWTHSPWRKREPPGEAQRLAELPRSPGAEEAQVCMVALSPPLSRRAGRHPSEPTGQRAEPDGYSSSAGSWPCHVSDLPETMTPFFFPSSPFGMRMSTLCLPTIAFWQQITGLVFQVTGAEEVCLRMSQLQSHPHLSLMRFGG